MKKLNKNAKKTGIYKIGITANFGKIKHPISIDFQELSNVIYEKDYNLDIEYKSHDDAKPYDEYLKFTKSWLKRCLKWLKSDGRMCLNIPLDKNKGGQQSVGADIIEIFSGKIIT